jgi:ParB-like chromosome segregation protein Spo0J
MKLVDKKIKDLEISKLNVRKMRDKTSDSFIALKNSIEATMNEFGRITEPPKITADGVIEGGERITALKELMKEGRIKQDEIQCQEETLTEKQAVLFSLIQNIRRTDLELMDRVKAIELLVVHYKMNIPEIAKFLGVTPSAIKIWMSVRAFTPKAQEEAKDLSVGRVKEVKSIIDKTTRYQDDEDRQIELVKASKEIPVRRLEGMSKEAEAGYVIKPEKEAKHVASYAYVTTPFQIDLFARLSKVSKKRKQTLPELVNGACLEAVDNGIYKGEDK